MKNTARLALNSLFYSTIFSVIAFGQTIPNTANQELRRQMENAARVEKDIENRMAAMRQLESKMIALSKLDSRHTSNVPQLDKKARERIFAARRIDPADLSRYGDLLRSDRTGIFKLFPDFECVSNNVIKIDGDCATFVPESSSFSFRTANYADKFYHDIGFNNSQLYSNAFFAQGIFVPLGDVPIESVDLLVPGVKELAAIKAVTDPSEARLAADGFRTGVELGGFTFSQSLKPVDGTTYAFRMIAYRLQNSLPPATEDSTITQLRFHSLAHDKRVDSIFVFRLVREGVNGELTIVWRELDRRDAPKIKFPKNVVLADFKP